MLVDGTIAELLLMDGLPTARLVCHPGVIPAPGQYLLGCEDEGRGPLAAAIFGARILSDGFIAEPPAPGIWRPGTRLHLRGPLGRGFALPPAARRIALIACGQQPRRLLALVDGAFRQNASVTLVCDNPPDDLPLPVEVQPIQALGEVCLWSDYAAFDVPRESLASLQHEFGIDGRFRMGGQAEALVRAPMPCGGLAECGVCTVKARKGPRLACVDGPVFDFRLLVLER